MAIAIDEYSLATVPLEMRFGETVIASATGFVWEKNSQHYLITNWHNVSGRDPNTDRHLSATAAEPNGLRGLFNSRKSFLGTKVWIKLVLRDQTDRIRWMVHPTQKRGVDVVAIPLRDPAVDPIEFRPINSMPSADMVLSIAMDVYVLGYPFGPGTSGLPVWKRGSIASEPQLVPEIEPYFRVDTASRPGMSGSPVIVRTSGAFKNSQGNTVMSAGLPPTKFIGTYSGRLATQDSLETQIGMVWPAKVIDEIITGGLYEYG